MCKAAYFANKTLLFFYRSLTLPSPISITRFYILFEQTINIIKSFVFSLAKSIYYYIVALSAFVTFDTRYSIKLFELTAAALFLGTLERL